MKYCLNIDWQGDLSQVSNLDVHLLPLSDGQPGTPLPFQQNAQRLSCEALSPGNYLLCFRYSLNEQHFDSFYFDLDIPDITLIQLRLTPTGSQIEQMGFLNDYGEFVDMLIYEEAKPSLTQAVEKHVLLQTLSEFLVFHIDTLPPLQARQQLSQVLGSLSESFGELQYLWPYQLKKLLKPEMLAQTSPEWKACLLHLLRNNLILMDNEILYERLQEAAELSQQQKKVDQLLADLEWDPEQGHWRHYAEFIAALKERKMLLY